MVLFSFVLSVPEIFQPLDTCVTLSSFTLESTHIGRSVICYTLLTMAFKSKFDFFLRSTFIVHLWEVSWSFILSGILSATCSLVFSPVPLSSWILFFLPFHLHEYPFGLLHLTTVLLHFSTSSVSEGFFYFGTFNQTYLPSSTIRFLHTKFDDVRRWVQCIVHCQHLMRLLIKSGNVMQYRVQSCTVPNDTLPRMRRFLQSGFECRLLIWVPIWTTLDRYSQILLISVYYDMNFKKSKGFLSASICLYC